MITTCGSVLRSFARALTGPRAEPVLMFVEGAAGEGKSHLLQELADLPDAPEPARRWWRCGAGGGPSEQDGHRPEATLWLVDDVHRADEDELRRLRGVLEGLGPGSAAAVTYRPEEIEVPGLPLGGTPMTYPGRLTVLTNRLAPWDEERVRRATEEALGGSGCTAEAVTRLHERTGGVPRVVVDLLAMVREQWPAFTGTAAEVDAAGVPPRLAELVLSRTHAVPPEHRPVVWAAAVLDGPAGRDELAAVSGLGAGTGTGALLGALEGAALAELGEGRYGFAVPLAASAVRATLPGPVRQDLHRRAANVLSRRQPVDWAAVAGHHRAAGEGHRWLRAVERAAESAEASGRHEQAIALLERTLALPGLPPQARARLAPLLARNAVTGLRSDQTVEVLAQIVQDAALPPAVRGELRLDLGLMLCNQMGRSHEGWQVLEVAAGELRDVRSVLAARAMAALVTPYWPGVSVDVHRGWLIQAVAAADDSGDAAMRTAVLANHVGLAMSCADPEAWELVEQLPVQSTDPACLRQAARGLCNAADSAVWLGFYERGADLLAAGRDLSARSGAPYTEHSAMGTRLLQQWWTGRWLGLDKRCEDFVAATADMPFIASDAYVVRGLLAVAQGDWGEARSWLSQQGTFGTEKLPVPLGAAAAGAVIRLALARQEVTAAAEHARAAWKVVADKGVWPWAAELAPWAVEALARAGDGAGAHTMVRNFAQGLGRRDAPAARAALVWSRAVLTETETEAEASAEGRRSGLLEAAALYGEAAAAYGELPRPYSQALTTEGAARCAIAADTEGDPDDEGASGPVPDAEGASSGPAPAPEEDVILPVLAELESCAQRFTDLGAVWDAARARALLRTRQPVRKGRPPGRPSHADQLSPREEEVAQLAVSGLTNREIAATLHLSPRTVEQHIAGAMRKTGALSRRDLAHRLDATP
ncbi:LuxR C-terminal-related transcriptional regulator [Streptomyces microflavus]|uniref:Helix-turn-helix transcriptional regulator n=1 Tax=Streptomyces microflavus TaxID=1919 RepID=A0A6N9VCT1_STRMI|nr:LuxR C-terminal-related transcriptional regulator [Streptomyces sp. BE282]MEE1730904.1 LuxR C-terminal-related transcriptional regulator [Streptomyces sp. BE282]NEB69385.1 helix-turn-helix transcriptional regulator [Streptomyces microflavus]